MKGVVIGKFYPPHMGHHYLIDTAIAGSDETIVLVVDNPEYAIPATKRCDWIAQHHPSADVRIIQDIGDDDNSLAWAQHTTGFLGFTPDIVFTSETYGQPWAKAMGCKHIDVDIARKKIPISGTKVRRDILDSWKYLSDSVKAGLALRIVIVGAESTGTTTLTHDLAEKLQVPWVPELGRYYTESIMTTDKDWTEEDFYRIGKLQQFYENEIAKRSEGVIVCDTNTVATELWQRRYMGKTTDIMRMIAAHDKADLYIVTGDEIPFVQDGVRDGEHIRHTMHSWFLARIKQTGAPYIVVSGNRKTRLNKAIAASQRMIATNRTIADTA